MSTGLPQHISESAFADFLREYHLRTSAADLASIDKSALRAAVVSHLQLGSVRQPGQISVRVFTPSEAHDGWSSPHTVVQLILDDMPFVVDSLTATLLRRSRGVIRVTHPIFNVQRDADGQLLQIGQDPATAGAAESWCEFVIHRLLTPAAHADLEAELREILADVVAVNRDWQAMRTTAVALADEVVLGHDAAEVGELLQWLASNHFTFLGYQRFDNVAGTWQPVPDSALGLLAQPTHSNAAEALAPLQLSDSNRVVLLKAPFKSTVHRAVHPQYIGLRIFDEAGRLTHEHRFVGLLSRDAYSDSALRIPIARRTAQAVLDQSGWKPGSHSYKDLLQFIEAFPRDLLLQVSADWLAATATSALANQGRRVTQEFLHVDDFGRFADVLVYLPRDIYNTAMRQRVEGVLRAAFHADEIESSVQMSDAALARLHFNVRLTPQSAQLLAVWPATCMRIDDATRSWSDDFTALVLRESDTDEAAEEFLRIWANAFDDVYRAANGVDAARADALLVDVVDGPRLRVSVGSMGEHRLRLLNPGAALKLAQLLPLLAALGLEVADEQPFELRPQGWPAIWLHDLGFSCPVELDAARCELLKQALLSALAGESEVDSLLALALSAELAPRQIAVLRAYASYVAQWGAFSLPQVQSALVANPAISRLLVEQFTALLDPAGGNADRAAELASSIDQVRSLEHDRVLRAIADAIHATVRTNYFQSANGQPRPAIALKLAPQDLTGLPAPRPFREIWVDSPRVRGVHLRFGPVARGGLRWSDRRDDLRTEVLGLVRAQVVKNAVIVPTGAKGGFLPKQLPDAAVDRDAWLAAGVAAYQEFIHSLLDVTDNRAGEAVVPPADTRRLDGDDAYLVVAADKGTATFSDIANAIALERGFWLADAFASGGSVGYDHKAMGITARGAWESVRHHFELLGTDVQTDTFTAVGIGDMSGDVFGNGMLLSKSMRLVAAFDHRHVFLDPSPDPAKSWAERERLFRLPRSSWADYNAELISPGGGVFARTDKRVEVSLEAAAALGIEPGATTPNELISAILRAPVDLLWNGGIGTYVKAQTETPAEVGDKANDAIRINGAELRCRVVGEGGNLGFTQAGRVEAALAGIRLNTDAIDNSAGVDTSDHEVNLKILFTLRGERLSMEARNELLSECTDEVARLVLADNIAQNRALAVAESHSAAMAPLHARLLADWSAKGIVDLKLEVLPKPAALLERGLGGTGLTRPELSVVLAHAKLATAEALLAGVAIDETWAEAWLFDYFPARLRSEFAEEIRRHPLRREIIATGIANHLINVGGVTVVWRCVEETGASADEAARALALAWQIGRLDRVFADIAELGPSKWPVRVILVKEARRFIDRVARWLLANRGSTAAMLRDIERFESATALVSANLGQHLRGHEFARWQAQAQEYVAAGADPQLAERVAGQLDAYAALDLVELVGSQTDELVEWSRSYFEISDQLGGDMLLSSISRLPRDDRWQTMARAALRADMYAVLAAVTNQVLRSHPTDSPAERIQQWLQTQSAAVGRVKQLLAEIGERHPVDIAAISVALRTLRALVSQTAAG